MGMPAPDSVSALRLKETSAPCTLAANKARIAFQTILMIRSSELEKLLNRLQSQSIRQRQGRIYFGIAHKQGFLDHIFGISSEEHKASGRRYVYTWFMLDSQTHIFSTWIAKLRSVRLSILLNEAEIRRVDTGFCPALQRFDLPSRLRRRQLGRRKETEFDLSFGCSRNGF
ncbi:unnamed protein product [Protopolystoma xenopodis]|uniref:Uncharacterized protein n=1 Tax=Protopolystoma xenopodis TaxID=117903 RepID=A0A3S5CTC0_9PLAT|nr:unnamed protein product [Protopolystoma xenopodis]